MMTTFSSGLTLMLAVDLRGEWFAPAAVRRPAGGWGMILGHDASPTTCR
jgi:hypothetical protein